MGKRDIRDYLNFGKESDEKPQSNDRSSISIEDKINELLENGTYVVVFGNWYDDYLMVAGTEIKADMKYLTVKPTCQGERAVATIHIEGALGIQAVMVQSFDEGAVRLRHVRVREGGVVKVKNERQNQEIFASVEHVGKAERLLIADQMLVRQYKGDKHSVAVITEFSANSKQVRRMSGNVEVQYPSQENVVEYILSKLPPAVTSGLSAQERAALALDTVKQFM